jgi:hypothetical protein
MTIETSSEYQTTVKTRRLFGNLTEHLQQIDKRITEQLELGARMRNSLGQIMLTLAHVEALYVDNCVERRKAEEQLAEKTQQLDDLAGKLSERIPQSSVIAGAVAVSLAGVQTQADRIATDRYVKDTEKGQPIPGVEYVTADWFLYNLMISRKVFDKLVISRELPEHDAVEEGGQGRPKFLWIKHKADAACNTFRKKPTRKGGRALA